MKHYSNLSIVLDALDELEWHGSLFTNRASWHSQPHQAAFLYLEGDDELEDIFDPDTLQPRLAHEAGMQHFLDIEIFKAILSMQKNQKMNSTMDDYIDALDYYREYDTFKMNGATER